VHSWTCLHVDSVVRGTNVTYQFEFGDGTQVTVTDGDVVGERHGEAVSLTHVYRDGELHCSSIHFL